MTDLTRATRAELRALFTYAEELGFTSTEIGDLLYQWKHGKRPPRVDGPTGVLLDDYFQAGVLCALAFGAKALDR